MEDLTSGTRARFMTTFGDESDKAKSVSVGVRIVRKRTEG